MDYITFVNKGLSEVKMTCEVYSAVTNEGDGHISCPAKAGDPYPPLPVDRNYVVMNTVDLVRLDEFLLNEEIYLLKIDTYVAFLNILGKGLNITLCWELNECLKREVSSTSRAK
jgi:hypothetical protein